MAQHAHVVLVYTKKLPEISSAARVNMGQIVLLSTVQEPIRGRDPDAPLVIPSWHPPGGKSSVVPHRWTGAWGRYARASLGQIHVQAQAAGEQFYTAEIKISIKDRPQKSLTPADLADQEYLPLDLRVSPALRQHICAVIRRRDVPDIAALFAASPALVNRLFMHPDFESLKAICWPGTSAASPGLCAVRSAEDVSAVTVRFLTGPFRLAPWDREWPA